MDELQRLGRPGTLLEQYRAASIAQSVDDMARLYAVEAVHEFPFSMAGLPTRLVGRDAIMEFVAAGWGGPLRYQRYLTLASYATDDAGTIVVQQEVHGTSATTGEFVLPNLVVMTTNDHEITTFRDFVNVVAAFEAMGLPLA